MDKFYTVYQVDEWADNPVTDLHYFATDELAKQWVAIEQADFLVSKKFYFDKKLNNEQYLAKIEEVRQHYHDGTIGDYFKSCVNTRRHSFGYAVNEIHMQLPDYDPIQLSIDQYNKIGRRERPLLKIDHDIL